MSGAALSINVRVDDREVVTALKRLARKVGTLKPALDEIGSRLEASTDLRFETETDPAGVPWVRSLRAKEENGQTLTDSGRLRQSITRRVRDRELMVGTNVVYAAIHQFGGRTKARTIRPRTKKALSWPGAAHPVAKVEHPGSDMPTRAFLGVDAGDRRAILRILARHLEEAVA